MELRFDYEQARKENPRLKVTKRTFHRKSSPYPGPMPAWLSLGVVEFDRLLLSNSIEKTHKNEKILKEIKHISMSIHIMSILLQS